MQFPFKLLLGILGNVTALALFLSPMPTFWSIFKLKSTQEYSAIPYVCTLFNCSLWLLYGMPFIKPNSILILTINGTGLALELCYLITFFRFASKKTKLKIMKLIGAMAAAYAILVVITISVLHSYSARQLLVGCAAALLSIAMYASPLSVIGLVIRTKSVEYMPFLLSLFNFMNALAWSAYSLVTKDIFVAVPSGIGCLLAIVQLTVYGKYRGRDSQQNAVSL